MAERAPKTHPSQWAAIVDFVENHREMVTHQLVGLNGRENYNKLWDELTTQLNSMGYGMKSSKKWQEVFGKWKSKIKVKAQDIVCGLKKTGGGGPLPQLSPVEERIMNIIGWKLVTGDENLELGVDNSFKLRQPAQKLQTTAHSEVSNYGQEVPPLIPFSSTPQIELSVIVSHSEKTLSVASNPLLVTDTPETSSTGLACTPRSENVTHHLKGKKRRRVIQTSTVQEKTLAEMHNEHLAVLVNINKNLERIADSQDLHNKLLLEVLERNRSSHK